MTTVVPSGAADPRTACPNTLPDASSGTNTRHAAASISICARRPAPRRSTMNTRHAEVKPNAAW